MNSVTKIAIAAVVLSMCACAPGLKLPGQQKAFGDSTPHNRIVDRQRDRDLEGLTGTSARGENGYGYVLTVNGTPHHYTNKPAMERDKKDYEARGVVFDR